MLFAACWRATCRLTGIVAVREQIATELRKFKAGKSADSATMLSLMEKYGELDGAIVYNLAVNFPGEPNPDQRSESQAHGLPQRDAEQPDVSIRCLPVLATHLNVRDPEYGFSVQVKPVHGRSAHGTHRHGF